MFNLNSINFKNLIESVHLNGIINECVLEIKEKKGIIQSIDTLNCLFVSNNTIITDDEKFELQIGLRELSILHRILSNINDSKDIKYEISKDEKWLILNIKGKGKVKLLTIKPEDLVTAVSDDDVVSQLLENVSFQIKITEKIKTDILYFLQMFKSKVVTFKVIKGKLFLQSHENEIHQFNISLGKVESEDISIDVNGTYFLTIISALHNTADSNIHIKENSPVLIDSVIDDNNYLWALSPISSI